MYSWFSSNFGVDLISLFFLLKYHSNSMTFYSYFLYSFRIDVGIFISNTYNISSDLCTNLTFRLTKNVCMHEKRYISV